MCHPGRSFTQVLGVELVSPGCTAGALTQLSHLLGRVVFVL